MKTLLKMVCVIEGTLRQLDVKIVYYLVGFKSITSNTFLFTGRRPKHSLSATHGSTPTFLLARRPAAAPST